MNALENASGETRPTEPDRPNGSGRRVVLLVEDNDADRDVYGGLLWYNGYDVVHAADGDEAVSRALELRPDIVLLDIRLAGELSGVDVAARLREEQFRCAHRGALGFVARGGSSQARGIADHGLPGEAHRSIRGGPGGHGADRAGAAMIIELPVRWRSHLQKATSLPRRVRAWLADLRIRRRLDRLQQRAADASAAFRPHYFLRAAQLAGALHRRGEALRLYGQAIDGYLEAGRSRSAEVVCRKVLDEYPEVIRARRTLALLALGREDLDEAVLLLRSYAQRAGEAGDPRLVMKSLRLFAVLAESGRVRAEAIRALEVIGDEEGVRWFRSDAPPPALFEGMGRWPRAIRAALLGPEGLRELPI